MLMLDTLSLTFLNVGLFEAVKNILKQKSQAQLCIYIHLKFLSRCPYCVL